MTDRFTQPLTMQTAVPSFLWGCPRTESEPVSAVSDEPVTFSLPVIQNVTSHISHIALLGLQPSQVALTTLSQRASLIRSSRRAPPRYSVQIRGAQGCSFLGALTHWGLQQCADPLVCSHSDLCCISVHHLELLWRHSTYGRVYCIASAELRNC